MQTFHPITGRNRYCGPSAMASVLGVSTDHAARVLRAVSDAPRITGVSYDHLIAAMERLGAHLRFTPLDEPYESLAGWLGLNLPRFKASHLILAFGAADDAHYGAICSGMYQCNRSRVPVALDAIPFRPKHGTVFAVVEVLDRPSRVPHDEAAASRAVLARAKRLAAKFGIVVANQGFGHFQVWCPELDHDDPLEGRNETGDVRVVLELVEEYQRCLRGGYLEAVTDPALFNSY